MKNKVALLLTAHGPMLSGELARIYEGTYNVSNVVARQALSRATTPVHKMRSITFNKNQKFFYLEGQYMSKQYCSALIKAIEEHSRTNSIYISAFLSQNGFVSEEILPTLVASPIGKIKGHKMHKRIMDDLIHNKIILEYDERYWTLSPMFNDKQHNISRAKGIEAVKKQIANDFARWAAKINWSAYNSAKTLEQRAEFAQFRWAYSAPSYVQPLYDFNKPEASRQGFIIADVFFGKRATVQDIRFFIDKIEVVRAMSRKNHPNFMPVFIVGEIEPEALKLLKEKMVTIAIIKNIFDDRYSKLLDEIVTIFANSTAIISKEPQKFEKLFNEISKFEGKFNNIFGDVFELLVGYYFNQLGCSYLKIGENIHVHNENFKTDLDVQVKKDGKIYVIECKAYRSRLSLNDVEKWIQKLPKIYKWLLERFPADTKHTFQLWSLGGFTETALELLNARKQNTLKYDIDYFNKEQIQDMARDNNVQLVVDIIKEHFIGTEI